MSEAKELPVLFQYIVIWDPTEKQIEDDGAESKIIVEPAMVLATDENTAFVHAARAIPEDFVKQINQCRVVVRPF